YLRTIPVTPTAVLDVAPGRGAIEGAESLTHSAAAALRVTPAPPSPADLSPPSLVVDFGREITGRVEIESASDAPAHVTISYGEPEDEAIDKPYTGVQSLELPPHGTATGGNSAYRYAKIVFLDGSSPIRISAIRCRHLYYPVDYVGSFASSDPLLDRI